MSRQVINIACATDDKYVPYCGVMLTSLLENNRTCEVSVYILVDKPLDQNNQTALLSLSRRYNCKIIFCLVDNGFLSGFPLKGDGVGYWSIVTYYRLYIADLLPADVDKVLYLDCDIIVNGSLSSLFEIDFDGVAIGGVTDMCSSWHEYYHRLQYDPSKDYFNAGVAMINLDYWRDHKIGQECLDYLTEHFDRVVNNDQDVLNAVLCDRKLSLPVTYNYQIQLKMPYFFDTYDSSLQKEIMETKNPLIIHYAARLKPWMVRYYSYPFNDLWHKYKRMSPWRWMLDSLPKERWFTALLNRLFLWPLGINLKKPVLYE